MGLAEPPFPHWQGEYQARHARRPWTHRHLSGEARVRMNCWTSASSCGCNLTGSLLGTPHKVYSLKKGRARAVWNNNLILTVALTESQVQAQLGHGWTP